jgi:hypothetical protein
MSAPSVGLRDAAAALVGSLARAGGRGVPIRWLVAAEHPLF